MTLKSRRAKASRWVRLYQGNDPLDLIPAIAALLDCGPLAAEDFICAVLARIAAR